MAKISCWRRGTEAFALLMENAEEYGRQTNKADVLKQVFNAVLMILSPNYQKETVAATSTHGSWNQ